MPCSRIPKCRVRPYSLPGNALVAYSDGMNEGSPSMVVLLLSARSAEPPHSSGSTGASAPRILPEAARVARPFSSAGNTGSASCQPSGRVRVDIRSQSFLPSALPAAHLSKACCHSAWAA